MLTIVSGGQTGVDRAALDTALDMRIPYRGWCPKGGWAEDLPQPPGLLALYAGLRETPDADPRQRTEWNVRDSDRLLVLTDAAGPHVSKGTETALEAASKLGKPGIVLDIDAEDTVDKARKWLEDAPPRVALCIAGPRESEAPGIYAKTRIFLPDLLARLATGASAD